MKTEKELAAILKTNSRRIALWRKAGLIKGIKTGRQWVYTDKAIEDFIERFEGKDLSADHYKNFM